MQPSRLRTLALLGALALVLLILCLGSYLVVVGRDVGQSLTPVIGFAAPTITTLLAFALTQQKLDEVHKQVNGNLSRVVDRNVELENTVTELSRELPPIEGGKHHAD